MELRIQAYKALQAAIERIATTAYACALNKHKKEKKKGKVSYTLPDEVRVLVDASSDVLKGIITPDEAMGILNDPTILYLRTKSKQEGTRR